MADGLLSLAWNNHSSSFCHMLSTVRETELYTDVTIACDGKFYPAHKLVLSTCSDYFHKIFERTPCKHPVIVIKDVECKNIEALLNYMYMGFINVNQSDLAQLIRAAELLEIKGLAVPDEPPGGSKRSVQTRDTSVDSSSPNPKRPRQDEKKESNQEEAPHVGSSVPSSQSSSSLRRGDSLEEQLNSYDVQNKVNQRQTHSEHRQDRKDTPACSRRSEQLDSEQGLDHLTPTRIQTEVAGHGGIKEEKVELENEREEGDMGFEYESLVTDLVGDSEGEDKEHLGVSTESFNHSLNEDSYSTEAGPSGLQAWPIIGEDGESGSQGYTGGLPLSSHPGQQPHPMQHMVGSESESRWMARGLAQGPAFSLTKKHQCPFCSYATGFHHNLTKHVRTHTGEKPFVCLLCPFRANQNSSLKRHVQRMHIEVFAQESIQVNMQEAPQV